jgi:hypothetical protein
MDFFPVAAVQPNAVGPPARMDCYHRQLFLITASTGRKALTEFRASDATEARNRPDPLSFAQICAVVKIRHEIPLKNSAYLKK